MHLVHDPFKLIAPAVIILMLLFLFGQFWRSYRNPAKRLSQALESCKKQVMELKKHRSPERRSAAFLVFENSAFRHQWSEFQETLHDQYNDIDGERVVFQTRSTVPSSLYFSAQSVVDTPLRTEYFRHLPGILTGLGIIGTFFGLILGLGQFDLGAPEKVQESVTGLIQDVFFAFIGSLVAIFCAMVVTHIEKSWLRVCYERLEQITDAIDGLFDAGVGEEYLAELVRTSQESSIQTRMLKDSLVTDLREMLQSLVETQVRESLKLAETLSGSYRESGDLMANQISQTIESSFRDPLQRIADSVSSASGDQSKMVGSMLQDVLVAFMAKLEGTFGQQFQGMSTMLEQSVGAIQNMQSGLASLVNDLRSASQESSQAVSEQLAKTLQNLHSSQDVMQASLDQMVQTLQSSVENMGSQGVQAGSNIAAQLERMYAEGESRQQKMSDQMEAFVQQLQESVGRGQTGTIDQIAATVKQLEVQMQSMVDGIGQSITRAQEDGLRSVSNASEALNGRIENMFDNLDKGRQEMDQVAQNALHAFQEQATSALDQLTSQLRSLTELVERERHAMRQTIDALGGQTERSLLGMQAGADKMRLAADHFDTAGTNVHQALQSSADLIDSLRSSSLEVASTTRDLSTVVADYRANRDSFAHNTQTLQSLVTSAQTEAALREKAVADLMRLSDQIHKMNNETGDYLDQVSVVLGRSFDEFGGGIERTLAKTMGALDSELDKAVRSLAGGVETVSEHIDDLSDVLGKAVHRAA